MMPPAMTRSIIIVLVAVALIGSYILYTNQPPPPDYVAMARPALVASAAATTNDDRLTAILAATDAYAKIVHEIKDVADAQLAIPELIRLANEAKRLDDELRQEPDARRALMESRRREVDACAMTMAGMMLSTTLRLEIMKTILDPTETMASTLQ